MLKAKVKRLEKSLSPSGFEDPYPELTTKELHEELKRHYREAHRKLLKKDKVEAEEFKKLFMDYYDVMARPYHPSVNNELSREERKELLKKQTEWNLKEAENEEKKERAIEHYESYIEWEEHFL